MSSIPNTRINHWRYDDGWHPTIQALRAPGDPDQEFAQEIVGWHCWVYVFDHSAFIRWMETTCPTADCIHRFNSGDPMITVHITDATEAMIFALKFNIKQ